MLLLFLLHAHYCDLRESFIEGRCLQLCSHPSHNVFWDHPVAPLMALDSDVQRDVEEDRMHFVVIVLRQLDPVLPLL